jgi:hypothetical protein
MARRATYGGLYVKRQRQKIGGKWYEYWYIYKSTQDESGKAKNVGPLGKAAIDERTGEPFFDPATGRFVPRFENENQVAYIYYDIDNKEWVPVKNPTGDTINELQSKALTDNKGNIITDWNLEKKKRDLKLVRSGEKRGQIVNLHPVSGPHDIPLYFVNRSQFRDEFNEELKRAVAEERERLAELEDTTAKLSKEKAAAEKKAKEADKKIKAAKKKAEAEIEAEKKKLKEKLDKERLKQIEDAKVRQERVAKLYEDFNEALELKGDQKLTEADLKRVKDFEKKRKRINQQMKSLVTSKGGEEVRKARAKSIILQRLTTPGSPRKVFGANVTKKQLEKWLENREVHIESEVKKDLKLKRPAEGTTLSKLATDEGAPAWYTDRKIMGAATSRVKPWHDLDRPTGTIAKKRDPSKWPTENREAISTFFHSLPGIHEAELYPDYDDFIASKEYKQGEKTVEEFVLENIRDRIELYTIEVNKDTFKAPAATRKEWRITGVAD